MSKKKMLTRPAVVDGIAEGSPGQMPETRIALNHLLLLGWKKMCRSFFRSVLRVLNLGFYSAV